MNRIGMPFTDAARDIDLGIAAPEETGHLAPAQVLDLGMRRSPKGQHDLAAVGVS